MIMGMGMFEKNTMNQHYISVAEQRLNQSNPEITNRKNREIISFDLIDREAFHIKLSEDFAPKAVENLKYIDLFTFGILDDGNRLCFENLFNRLECDLIEHTNHLLDSKEDEFKHFIYVFKSKLMNMIRNPFCIKKTLKSFGDISGYIPVDESLKEYFNRIDEYDIPINILNDFDVNELEYRKWLKIIFLMITPLYENKYILDIFAESYFEYDKFFHIIKICKFTESVCLLSDRSYIDLSALFADSGGISFGFNLRSDAFIYIAFFKNDIEQMIINLLQGDQGLIDKYSKLTQLQYSIEIDRDPTDIKVLENFNKQAIYQCHKNVFAASIEIQK